MKITGVFNNVLNILFKSPKNDTRAEPEPPNNSFEAITNGDLKGEVCWNVFSERNTEWFLKLIKDNIIEQFLEFDNCFKLADKYLLAMVFVYFIRAKLPHSEYNRDNFFAALYLAHDVEEDNEDLKMIIMRWGLGIAHRGDIEYFLQLRDSLWVAMGYRACVSVQTCHQVMQSIPKCNLWRRERSSAHAGAVRDYEEAEECEHCDIPHIRFYGTDVESSEPEESDFEDWDAEPAMKKIKLSEE